MILKSFMVLKIKLFSWVALHLSLIHILEKLPNVLIDIPKREGGSVRYHASMGVIHIVAKDVEELCETIDTINKTVKFTSVDGQDMFIYFTNLEELRDEYYEGLREFGIQ